MKISKIIIVICVVNVIILGMFGFFFARPVSYTEYSGDGFLCMVPANSQFLVFEDSGWHKHYSTDKGELYISHRPLKGTFEEELQNLGKNLQGASYQKDVKIFDSGRFFLYERGRGWRKYIYLFSVDQEVFWVENLSKYSTLLTYKEIVDRVVTTMEVRNRTSDPYLPLAIADINKEIVRYAQSPVLLMGMIAAIILGTTLLLPGAMLYFGGLAPSIDESRVVRKEKWVYAVIREPWKYKGTFGTLVLTMDTLTFYYFRRPLLTISREEAEWVSLAEKGGKFHLLVKEGKKSFRIHVRDPHVWMSDIRSNLH